MYSEIIKTWSAKIPTTLISYDHPSLRHSLKHQISDATELLENENRFLKEILIKPDTQDSTRINVDNLVDNLALLKRFDIIGFTEKELGFSVFKRMESIARIRKSLDKMGLVIPIHVFGSLDPVTTPLYYLSGADIFDGLAWIRFIFDNGNTLYSGSFGPKRLGIEKNMSILHGTNLILNYHYILDTLRDLETFQSTGKIDSFQHNTTFFNESYDKIIFKIFCQLTDFPGKRAIYLIHLFDVCRRLLDSSHIPP